MQTPKSDQSFPQKQDVRSREDPATTNQLALRHRLSSHYLAFLLLGQERLAAFVLRGTFLHLRDLDVRVEAGPYEHQEYS